MNGVKKSPIGIVIMFVVSFTCCLVYLVTQQSLRLSANELPAQLAAETVIRLENGQSPQSVVSDAKVDITRSIAPFVMIYDTNKNLQASSAVLGKNEPSFPKGVLDYAAQKGVNRVTWQPGIGLRFATVTVKTDKGFVVAGRSLMETENVIQSIGTLVLMAWIACLICISIALAILRAFSRRMSNK